MPNGNAGNNTLTGTSNNDSIYGGGGDDVVYGGGGSDGVRGDAGNDILYGGDGDDFVDGGTDADTMYGGDGNDTYVVENAGDVVIETADGGIDTVRSFITYRLSDNVERLTLMGTAALNGTGNALANLLTGNAADNVLDGLDGNDTLAGGAGDDVLAGGAGTDILFGGAGADRFVFDRADMVAGSSALDTLADLNFAEGDRLVFTGFDAAPVEVGSYADLVAFVRATPGAGVVKRDSAGVAQVVLAGANGAEQRLNIIDKSGTGTAWTQFQTAASATPTPTNTAPVTAADAAGTAQGSATSIDVLANDRDDAAGMTLVSATRTAGLGDVSVVDGKVRFDPGEAFDHLAAGQTETATVEYLVRDAGGLTARGTLTVTVTGTNDAAVVTGEDSGTVVEDYVPTARGTLAVTDVDTGEARFQAATGLKGTYGTLSITEAGAWTYTLDNADRAVQALGSGRSLTDSVFVYGADGTAKAIDVTINGTNDAATLFSPGAVVSEDGVLTATGTAIVNDVDSGEAQLRAETIVGLYGTTTVTAGGAWTYVLDNAGTRVQSLGDREAIEQVRLTSVDGAQTNFTIAVRGANDAAVIGGVSTGTVREDTTFTAGGTLSVTDVDTGEASFRPASDVAGSYGKLTINGAGVWSYTLNNGNAAVQALNAGQTLTDSITVRSADGTAKAIDVTIQGTDDASAPFATTTVGAIATGTRTDIAVSNVATSVRIGAMTVDVATGDIYAQAALLTTVDGVSGRSLYKVGNDGTATLLTTGFNAANDMEFSNGAVYALRASGDLVKYDLATGTLSVDSTPVVAGWTNRGMALLPDGKFLIVSTGSGTTNITKYDPVTHVLSPYLSGIKDWGYGIEYDAASGLIVMANSQGALYKITPSGATFFSDAKTRGSESSLIAIAPGGEFVYQRDSGGRMFKVSVADGSYGFNSVSSSGSASGQGDLVIAPSRSGGGYSLYMPSAFEGGQNIAYGFSEAAGFNIKFVPFAKQPDPIVLDLNGDGVHFAGHMAFDLDADGTAEHLAAVSPADGLLVMDLDGSGAIEDGREMLSEVFEGFGYGNSMEALRSLDGNLDGLVDAKDARFGDLLVWRDANGDGVSQPGELYTLDSLGIVAVSVREVATDAFVDGQQVFATGTFTYADATTGDFAAVRLAEADVVVI